MDYNICEAHIAACFRPKLKRLSTGATPSLVDVKEMKLYS